MIPARSDASEKNKLGYRPITIKTKQRKKKTTFHVSRD